MERLFSPCTRLHDILESQGSRSREPLQELDLDVSTEELLSFESGFTYADLYAVLGNEGPVAWLTPHAFVVPEYVRVAHCWMQLDDSCRSLFYVDGSERGIYAFSRSQEHLLEIYDGVLRLLAASVVHSVVLGKGSNPDSVLINAPTLAHLMEECQSLKVLTLERIALDENHCRVLGGYSRPGLKIELYSCAITSSGTSALAEVLGRNQGPAKLNHCEIDYSVLADGLRGNIVSRASGKTFPRTEKFLLLRTLSERTKVLLN
jgi:hypothetical protein